MNIVPLSLEMTLPKSVHTRNALSRDRIEPQPRGAARKRYSGRDDRSNVAPEVSTEPNAGTAASAKRRVGRPKQSVLSRSLILETGLQLMDEHGADAAGMRAIAKRLDVRPSAL